MRACSSPTSYLIKHIQMRRIQIIIDDLNCPWIWNLENHHSYLTMTNRKLFNWENTMYNTKSLRIVQPEPNQNYSTTSDLDIHCIANLQLGRCGDATSETKILNVAFWLGKKDLH